MFSNGIKSFIILNIYFLIIVNIVLILSIYFKMVKDKIAAKRYVKALKNLQPNVLAYIENEDKLSAVSKLLKSAFAKNVVIDIMVDYSEKSGMDISEKFIQLNLDSFLIKRISRRLGIADLKKLALMKASTAYDTLLKVADHEDMDMCYMSFYALSLINLSKEKKETTIKKLVASHILRDRIVEIIDRFCLSIEDWLKLLEKEQTAEGKVIFIQNLALKDDMKRVEHSDRILRFLNYENEVTIAAIHALSNSKNDKYVNTLIDEYENEESWQVRMAVAKGLSNFSHAKVKATLLKMTHDKEWWVRYNAIKSIVAMGDEGLFTLIDLSLEVEDKNIADLAYYFLNSNKDVYNTVKNIEV